MLENGFPKVNDKAVIPEPKVCIQPGLDWVRSKVVAYLDHGDVVSAVCNYMLENGFPKVNDKAVIPEPKVCIQPGLGSF